MLRHIGVEADVAVNGRDGVEAVMERPYDVVLMDIQMPIMDGVEAMRSLRTLLPPERCPRIVAVTAHAVVGTRERMIEAGFDGFYNKPVSIAMLREAIAPPPRTDLPALTPMIQPHSDDAAAASVLLNDIRAHVRSLLGEDDEEFVTDLVETFSATSRQAVRDVSTATTTGDGEAVAAAAHKLKGSASNVGLASLASSWGGIETSIRSGGGLPAGALEQAVAETEQALAALRA